MVADAARASEKKTSTRPYEQELQKMPQAIYNRRHAQKSRERQLQQVREQSDFEDTHQIARFRNFDSKMRPSSIIASTGYQEKGDLERAQFAEKLTRPSNLIPIFAIPTKSYNRCIHITREQIGDLDRRH